MKTIKRYGIDLSSAASEISKRSIKSLMDSQEDWVSRLKKDIYMDPTNALQKMYADSHASILDSAMREAQRTEEIFKTKHFWGDIESWRDRVTKQAEEMFSANRLAEYDAMSRIRQKMEGYATKALDMFRGTFSSIDPTMFSSTFSSTKSFLDQKIISGFAVSESFIDYEDKIRSVLSTATLSDVYDTIKDLCGYARELPSLDFVVNEDQTLSYAGQTLSAAQIQTMIDEKLSAALSDFPDKQTCQEWVTQVVTAINKVPEPWIKTLLIALIVNIILQFINPIFNPIHDQITNNYIKKEKRALTKTIQRSASDMGVPQTILSEYRFVDATTLSVRIKPNRRSAGIGKLYFGQIVKVTKKKKDWTLIEWSNPDGDLIIKGWVYTRYIKKFKTNQ